jgi:hypothetical protein
VIPPIFAKFQLVVIVLQNITIIYRKLCKISVSA